MPETDGESANRKAKSLLKKKPRKDIKVTDDLFSVPKSVSNKYRLYFSPADSIPHIGYLLETNCSVETNCSFNCWAVRLILEPSQGFDAHLNNLNGLITLDYGIWSASSLQNHWGKLEMPPKAWVETVWQNARRRIFESVHDPTVLNSSEEFQAFTPQSIGGYLDAQLLRIALLWTYWERARINYHARAHNCNELNVRLPGDTAFAEDNFRKICITYGLLLPKPRSKPMA